VTQILHRHGKRLRPAVTALQGAFLVGNAPDDDARMVPVAQEQALELAHEFIRESEPPVLVHHEHSHPVAQIEHLRRRRVMRHPICVDAHLLEFFQAELEQRVGKCNADAGMVLVIADAFEDDVLAVEEETLVLVELDRADSEIRRGFVNRIHA
jgi:hypothetical protein